MYGLLGKSLKHSMSLEIHSRFGNESYRLFETEHLDYFMKERRFDGINVTIPYKEQVLPYLDELDEIARKTKCVNTIIQRDNKLIGYNTDYFGLKSLLEYRHINCENKKILLIGNGGAAKTASLLFYDLKAKIVTKICRSIKENDEIEFKEFDKVIDYDIIVNTTPIGMYPHLQDSLPFSLKDFINLFVVIDLIYNPIQTKLLLEAKENNIKAYNGLYMLVFQALKSHELFFNQKISLELGSQIYFEICKKMMNLVLVGLPLSGKSKYAKKLGLLYNKNVLDSDKFIEKKLNLSIPEIFKTYGESFFREQETAFVEKIYKSRDLVIATGGGMILNSDNMIKLKQNGFVIFLDKDPKDIAKLAIQNRPLIKQGKDILLLSKTRRPLYQKYADITINISQDAQIHIKEIEAKVDEFLNN
ncbi:MAG: hypothetical protein KJ971_01275 [Firmicutes bacterium]|nr:hypothetical protein [Bacillota bacterium]